MDEAIIVVDDDQEARLTSLREDSKECQSNGHFEGKLTKLITECNHEQETLLSSPAMDSASTNGNAKQNIPIIKQEITGLLPCTICASPSNGYHFGALSCAACNAFFRRSVTESRKYFCRKEGECLIDQSARCFCRACRLKKCLEKGMDPNAVQPHRDIIGQKRRRHLDDNRSDVPDSALTVAIDSLDHPQSQHFKMSPANPEHINVGTTPLQGVIPTDPAQVPMLCVRKQEEMHSKLNGSATAQLLNSPSAIAEQLLALSRAPLMTELGKEERGADLFKNNTTPLSLPTKPLVVRVPSSVSSSSAADPPLMSQSHTNNVSHPSSLAEYRVNDGSVVTDKLMQSVSFDDFNRSVEHEEVVEHFSSAPSTSSSWYFEDTDGKQWHQMESANRGPNRTPYDSSLNQIEHLVRTYAKLRERRRLMYCPGTLTDILSGSEPPLRPAAIGEHCSTFFRIEIGLIAEFINSIHPYSKLGLDDRVLLFKNVIIGYVMLEKHYVTMRLGGYQANRLINTDYSYHDLNTIQPHLETVPKEEPSTPQSSSMSNDAKSIPPNDGDKVRSSDAATVKRLLMTPLRDALRSIAAPMYHFGMTDVEFVSLVVVILFDHSVPGLSEPAKRLVKEARDRMYRDWFAYYERHSIADGPQRVGNAMLLLPALKVTCDQCVEDYHLVRFFGLLEVNYLIDEVMR